MKNRICLVTGGTSGVGKAIAIGLAELGATVVIVSRNEERGAFVTKEIQRRTGNRRVFYRVLDLEKMDRIHEFVSKFKDDFHALHVLSNNAALLPLKKKLTANGIEKVFAVNYLSHFMLTYLLLNFLKQSAPARILTVSGSPFLLKFGKIDLSVINLNKQYHPLKATYRAAVAKVAFSYELSKRLQGSGVTSNTFHPGLVKTHLIRYFPRFFQMAGNAIQYFFSDKCETGVYLASSPEVEGITGQFFKNKKRVHFHPLHSLDAYASDLWEKSKELSGLS